MTTLRVSPVSPVLVEVILVIYFFFLYSAVEATP